MPQFIKTLSREEGETPHMRHFQGALLAINTWIKHLRLLRLKIMASVVAEININLNINIRCLDFCKDLSQEEKNDV